MARASDHRLRKPGFESCAAVLNLEQVLFILHCFSSFNCINEYLPIESGGHLFTNGLHTPLQLQRGWMFPREVEMVFDWTGLPGNSEKL